MQYVMVLYILTSNPNKFNSIFHIFELHKITNLSNVEVNMTDKSVLNCLALKYLVGNSTVVFLLTLYVLSSILVRVNFDFPLSGFSKIKYL